MININTDAELGENEGLTMRLDKIERKLVKFHDELIQDVGSVRTALKDAELSEVTLHMVKSGLELLERKTSNM